MRGARYTFRKGTRVHTLVPYRSSFLEVLGLRCPPFLCYIMTQRCKSMRTLLMSRLSKHFMFRIFVPPYCTRGSFMDFIARIARIAFIGMLRKRAKALRDKRLSQQILHAVWGDVIVRRQRQVEK